MKRAKLFYATNRKHKGQGCTGLPCSFEICLNEWDCELMQTYDPDGNNASREDKSTGKVNSVPNGYEDSKITVFPNPASEMVTVWYNCQNPEGCKMEILNSQGVTIRNLDLPSPSAEILFHKDELAPGVYTFRLFDSNKTLLQKVIVLE